jgi:hypothetical protein
MAQPGSRLPTAQDDLHGLCHKTAEVAHFLSMERCEEAIDGLAPFYQEAFQVREGAAEGLKEKDGAELIDAILHRRQGSTPSRSKAPARSNTDKKRPRNEEKQSPAAKPAPPAASPAKSEPRISARKTLAIVEAEDAPEEEVSDEEIKPWNYDTHGNVQRVARACQRDGAFGLVIDAALTGKGNRTATEFFADGASLAAVDAVAKEDKKKHAKVVGILSKGVRQLLREGEQPELVELLQGSEWGRTVLADQKK